MSEITLSQMLTAREKRAKTQKQLLKAYNKPIISFTMNIAGPKKNSPLIERAFDIGLKRIKGLIPNDKIILCDINIYDTGCEAYLCVDMPAKKLKEICTSIEDENKLGRLFDMDVIDTDENKLSRKDLRTCIVCGASGRECAAGRIHSLEELEAATNKIIYDYFKEYDKSLTADFAVKSLIQEVRTTPKPGLVDRNNNGSHTDMSLDTFIKSADALYPYFAECFSIGERTSKISPCEVFPLLKSEGLCAEKTMYAATNGVNTHKGIIYSLGIICAAIGRLWTADVPYKSIEEIVNMCSLISSSAIKMDFKNIDISTAGGYYYQSLGIKGIRGEVLSGFSSVTDIALPTYKNALKNGYNENNAGVLTLLNLIGNIKDTNLYHRGGEKGAKYAADYASSLLKKDSELSIDEVKKMDERFIKMNLSPGGCADLLAITYFFHNIENLPD